MSTMAAVPRDNRAPGFWASTVGKKIVMAVTGIILFAFVIGHLLGNLQVFEGPAKLNAYGAFLHSIGEFLWPVRIILLIAVTLHIVATVQLALRKKRARPVNYSVKKSIASSYASRTMYWSGPIVLAFIIFHLLHLTAGYIHPGAAYIEGDVYHNVVSGFQVWWVSLSYVVAVSLLGLHLRHGLWSMFQSLGIHQPQHTLRFKNAAMVIALLITLGYLSIPISVLLGLVK
ncbi:MAG: succinate dehydrogenase cytochrome b subunit [Acidobacteriaceae bacterium]